ncbi:DUF4411 family protein, partial [Mycobacterium sp. 1245111.1]|uniref:DUF4411 family protein n=1 Tax=Mycobacterium sp. 1245111.1 TaxID=1834073 RepID=UPI000A68EE21
MSDAKILYCIDTSALIDWLERYYPPAAFPAIVAKVDALIAEGRLGLPPKSWRHSLCCLRLDGSDLFVLD